MQHPSGVDVVECGDSQKGFLFTCEQNGIDIVSAVKIRIPDDPQVKMIQISDAKLFVQGAVPIACHTIEQRTTAENLRTEDISQEGAESLYRHAFDTMMSVITKNERHLSSEAFELLSSLDTFRREKVRWASVTPNGGIISKDSGQIGDAWVFILPKGHFLYQEQKSVHSVHIDDSGLIPYLSILPQDMTAKWAMLGAVHELQHLSDIVLGVEPKRGETREQYLEGERRAYTVEIGLANAYSEGRLKAAFQQLVSNACKADDPILALNALVGERLPAIAQSIDQCMRVGLPKSIGELGVRQGLYAMLIGFEIANKLSENDVLRMKEMQRRFIEMIYEPLGVLPKR
jgi:hypothetical protein